MWKRVLTAIVLSAGLAPAASISCYNGEPTLADGEYVVSDIAFGALGGFAEASICIPPLTIVLENEGVVGESGNASISFSVARLDGAPLPAFDVVLSIYAENIDDLTNPRPPLRFRYRYSLGGPIQEETLLVPFLATIEKALEFTVPAGENSFFINGGRGGRVRLTATLNEDQTGEPVPEPRTWTLLALGLGGAGVRRGLRAARRAFI